MISIVNILQHELSCSCDRAREAILEMKDHASNRVQEMGNFVLTKYHSSIVPRCRNAARFCRELPRVTVSVYSSSRQSLSHRAQRIQQVAIETYHSIQPRCQRFVKQVTVNYQETVRKASEVFNQNRHNFFFIACCLTSVYFAPQLFFTAMVITVIAVYPIKKITDTVLMPDYRPYSNLQNENYVSPLDFTLEAIGTINAIALGTVYSTTYPAVTLLPVLSGIAAGNAIAKWGINTFNLLSAPPAA